MQLLRSLSLRRRKQRAHNTDRRSEQRAKQQRVRERRLQAARIAEGFEQRDARERIVTTQLLEKQKSTEVQISISGDTKKYEIQLTNGQTSSFKYRK